MLYLPKITVCKTLTEEVIPDTLSKLCVIPSALQTSAHFTVAQILHYLPEDLWACGLQGAQQLQQQQQQQPALPTPQKTLK